jgi:alanine racemase
MGATVVVPELARAGCRNWFVAHWSEAAALLPHVPAEQVAVLHGPLNDADVAFALESGVRPVLNSLEQARRWSAAGGGACHVMVDTGINRLGLAMGDLGDPVLQALTIDCCISHLASADEDVPQNAQQLNRFGQVRQQVSARRYSLANSAGSCWAMPITRT